ncbi:MULTISPECIES: SAM-dependent methyltransferase [Tenacibaculum]|uniref:SAM-dependent methyltransferase n=2 Tax=Tenacibaculum TaxID=104267 RepID=A0ABN5T7C6_9FLAO|nr:MULTISPECIES: SAM-dependent methyltransferase [Tenacibaculum]GFD71538.1 SAM-dependent methyltransferase [Tenacibaculum sp. KUL113]GFD91276.1 SAM-dependent methyltransferase [Alteromonas sp. KUL154]GFE03663.1 SAM-dependent methyltransferase [Alteromonas sp. KUL156]AZJ33276.1 SAM-dependent methyltransferase [Tenacibaculum mesophilum]KAF9659512.1 SAM-dependent methyltransferase [Tenacibaculum mesophilum]
MIELSETFWNNKYLHNKTGWDLGKISNPLKEYVDQLEDKSIQVLIPGGGNSYEAECLFNKGFKNVFVVDIASTPLKRIQKRVPNFPKENLIHADFFELKGTFDLIIEQTFFCAINPGLRLKYAQKAHELLTNKGKLVGLLFDAVLNEDHPPFGGNKNEYEKYFAPYFTGSMEPCYNSSGGRKGMELFVKMIKK